jgi:pilus assembly protein CpaC
MIISARILVRFILVASVVAASMILRASAQEADTLTRRINMGVGKSVILDLPRDASEIFLGNPKVANAIVRSARKIYIIGMEAGQTSLFALDSSGRQIATLDISIGRDIGDLETILRTALPKNNISMRTVNDTIILTGSVDSARDAQQAVDIASGFLTNSGGSSSGKIVNSLTIRGQDQVMVKVTIAEVRRAVLKQLGVSSMAASGNWGELNIANAFGISGAPPSSLRTAGHVASTLQALERYGVARILAEPAVTAVSGESAKFTAGGEMPVPTGQNCTLDPTTNRSLCTASVAFRPYGVTLNFTPVVMNEGRIQLRVATEVTEVDPTQSITYGNTPVYGFLTRKNETTVELPSGASIASAGLIQVRSRQVLNGLPGLMDLPIIGSIFRSRDYQREESELMIIITPIIARPVSPQELKKPTDHLVDASDPQAVFLGRVNETYGSSDARIGQLRGRVGFIND